LIPQWILSPEVANELCDIYPHWISHRANDVVGSSIIDLGVPSMEIVVRVLIKERLEDGVFSTFQIKPASQIDEASGNDGALFHAAP
jgi:hypothetical protein